METIAQTDDPDLRYAKQRQLFDAQLSGMKADSSWREWYSALEEYFPKPLPEEPAEFDFSTSVQACGWAGIIVLSLSPWTHWLIWTVSILAGGGGLLFSVFQSAMYALSNKSSISHQLASILRELRTRRGREKSVSASNER